MPEHTQWVVFLWCDICVRVISQRSTVVQTCQVTLNDQVRATDKHQVWNEFFSRPSHPQSTQRLSIKTIDMSSLHRPCDPQGHTELPGSITVLEIRGTTCTTSTKTQRALVRLDRSWRCWFALTSSSIKHPKVGGNDVFTCTYLLPLLHFNCNDFHHV